MEIGQKRKRDSAHLARPIGVRETTIYADTQNLGVCSLKLREFALNLRNFTTSCRGEVERVKHHHYVTLTLELIETYLAAKLIV